MGRELTGLDALVRDQVGAESAGRPLLSLTAVLVAAVLLVLGPACLALGLLARTVEPAVDRVSVQRVGDVFPGRASSAPGAAASAAPTGTNVLLVGSDSRELRRRPDQWVPGQQRTDALLLVHLAHDRRSAAVISIPRDSWVPVHGRGRTKINAAYSHGGPALLVRAVQELTKVRVDHYVAVDFDGFTALTDQLGGVLLPVDGRPQRLDGDAALRWVRERRSLPRGDLDRVRRQQAYLRAVVRELSRQAELRGGPWLAARTLQLSRSVAVDDRLDRVGLTRLVRSLAAVHPDDVDFLTVPVDRLATTPAGESVVLLDRARAAGLWRSVREDRVPAWAREEGARLPEVVD